MPIILYNRFKFAMMAGSPQTINARFHSDFELISPFIREAPTDEELAHHSNIFRGSVDFVMKLPDDQAGYTKAWIEQLPADWHDERTDIMVRMCKSIKGHADSKPHPHLDTVPGENLVKNYTEGEVCLEQILSFDGVNPQVRGTAFYRGECGLYVPENTFNQLKTQCPWQFEINQHLESGALTTHVLRPRERALMTNQTLHQAPLAVSNDRRIFLRARRKLKGIPIKHKNRIFTEEPDNVFQYEEGGKIITSPRKEVAARLLF